MARETKVQRASRMANLLSMYDAQNRALAKLTKEVKDLKEQIRAEEAGQFGDFVLSFGAPRVILDQPAARKALTDAGLEVPMTTTEPVIVVNNTAASTR